MNVVANSMTYTLKNDKPLELSHIDTFCFNDFYELSRIKLYKTQVLASFTNYSMLTFITANKKALLIHVVYILVLDNFHVNVVEKSTM